jgi:lysylphosphatidylglycerol synthetase-like protein (DUF2156 family)
MQTQFNIYLVVLTITFFYGLVRFSKLTSPFKLLLLLVSYVFISELIIRFVLPLMTKNVSPAYHFTVIVLIIFYALMYRKLFSKDPKLRRLIVVLAVILGTIALLNSFFYQGLFLFPSFSIAAQGILCIFLSLMMFKKMIESPTKTLLTKQPLFWFNLGTLSFYSFNFIGIIFYNEYELEEMTYWLFYLNVIGNWILYSFYLLSFYLNQKAAHER